MSLRGAANNIDLPIIARTKLLRDWTNYPHVNSDSENKRFANDLVDRLCDFGLHLFEKPDHAVLSYIDKLCQYNEALTKTSRKTSSQEMKNLIFINAFLNQLKEDKVVRNFYYCDTMLRNELKDPKLSDNQILRNLDNLGVDFLLEDQDGKLIPLQVKATKTSNSKAFFPLSSHDELQELTETQKKDIGVHENDSKLYLLLKRKIPKFNCKNKIYDGPEPESNYQNFKKFIETKIESYPPLDFKDKRITELNSFDFLKELLDKKYIEICNEDKLQEHVLKRSLKKKLKKTFRMFCQNSQYRKGIHIKLLTLKNDFFRTNPRISNRALKDFCKDINSFNEQLNGGMKKRTWFKYLFARGGLHQDTIEVLEMTSRKNPNSKFTIDNFIQLKKDLAYSLIDYSSAKFDSNIEGMIWPKPLTTTLVDMTCRLKTFIETEKISNGANILV